VIMLEELSLRQERSEPERQVIGPSQERRARRFGDQPDGDPIEECSMSACMERPDNVSGGN
jgi:hypothetical protein